MRPLLSLLLLVALTGADRAVAATAPGTAAASAADPSRQDVVIETTEGQFTIRLYPEDAPKTVANFVKLVAQGFYDSLTFHRVVPGFVLQGGDPNSRDENPFNDGQGGPGYTVPAEIKRMHEKGAVAMARQPDVVNPARESNGSQFYIALRDLAQLDGSYTVFGKVVSGWDTVEKLVALAARTDIARVGNNANPGKLALIRRARLVARTHLASARAPAKKRRAAKH
jgi:cyclophilin family peptidyl-prolyl cis-trans isomerase